MKDAAPALLACLIAASLQIGIATAFAADGMGNNNGNGNLGNGNGNGNSGNNNGNGNFGDLNGNNEFTNGNGSTNEKDDFDASGAKRTNFGDGDGLPFAHFGRIHGRSRHEGGFRVRRPTAP